MLLKIAGEEKTNREYKIRIYTHAEKNYKQHRKVRKLAKL